MSFSIEPEPEPLLYPEWFDVVTVRQIQIPGLPDPRWPMLADIEREMPERLPTYSVGAASIYIFCRSREWLRLMLDRTDLPDPGHIDWFPHPVPRGERETRNSSYNLAEVEHMVRFLHAERRISYDRFVMSLQLVAWTARGHGLLVDTRGHNLG